MTQQNAALVEESAAAAQSMHDQADQLAQAVSVFTIGQGVGGVSVSPASRAGSQGSTHSSQALRLH